MCVSVREHVCPVRSFVYVELIALPAPNMQMDQRTTDFLCAYTRVSVYMCVCVYVCVCV